MEHSDFYALVKTMRQAQRDYFACKAPSALHKAKELEREVDKALKEYANRDKPKQSRLY